MAPIQFDKVIVFFLNTDEEVRCVAEDESVRQIRGVQGVAAYTLIPETELETMEKVRSRLQSEDFDGAVTMRLTGIEEQKAWVPGQYPRLYNSFY